MTIFGDPWDTPGLVPTWGVPSVSTAGGGPRIGNRPPSVSTAGGGPRPKGPNDKKDNDPRRGKPLKVDAKPTAARGALKRKLATLRAAGYRLPNGWGPKAERAWKNFQLAKAKGLDPAKAGAYWSANQGTAGAGDTDVAGHGGGDTGGTGAEGAENPLGSMGAQFEQLLTQAMQGILNPSQFAVNAANTEYNGSINELAREIKRQGIQGGQNVHDLNQWYNQVETQRAAGAKANVGIRNQAQNSLNDTTAAIAGALQGTPDAAGLVGAWGQTMAAGLQGDANAQIGFDNSFKGILEAQEAAAKTNEQNYMTKLVDELRGKRTDLIAEKGSARAKYLAEANSQKFQQLAALQNLIIGASQMDMDFNIKKATLEGAQTQNQLDELKLDYARDQLAAGGEENPNDLPMDTRMELINSLKGSVTSRNKAGVPHAKPQTLFTRFASELGLDTMNPEHRRFLLSVLRALYPNAKKYPFKF